MEDLEQIIRKRFLDQLEELTWGDYEPARFGTSALPYFVAALENETAPKRRARLVRVIWQFRDPAALPALAVALHDKSSEVWKDALDGIVTLGGSQALAVLNEARAASAARPHETEKLSWIDEAIAQITEGF